MTARMRGRVTTYTHDGLTFDVRDDGPVDGAVVVLLHGFPERATCWRAVAPLLHAQGYRTLAPDQRGYSPGARPPRRRDYGTPHLAGDVAALIDLAGGPVHVVGHDWGAVVAWVLAMRRPDLIRTLTAISVPHPTAFLLGGVRQLLKSWYILSFQLPWLPELAANRAGWPFDRQLAATGMSRDDIARFRAEIVDDGALPGGLGWYRALPFHPRDLVAARVTVPTTFIWSDGDAAVSRQGAERSGRYVDAPYRLVGVEGVSHWLPTQAPEACADAILARIGPS